ncbi:MAG TPA: class II fructose-1,6-bisphosphate aldolase [Actinobacteria bacterium]|nr:class II fructose-1,6-bisphosphate aldolase [Actinomycetota bacterium]
MLVTMKEQLQKAKEGKYAVGMFNVMTVEMLQAVIEAAEEMRSPVIVGTSEGMASYIGIKNIAAMVKIAAEATDIPISLHLDHGTKLETLKKTIDAGYTSVMIDGSKNPLEENIAITREGAAIASPHGVTVEGELGRISGTEDTISVSEREASMTMPDEAEKFVAETGVDCLAVSIGNAHGIYKGEPKLDFDRLREIKKRVSTLLVLHGASGIPDDAVQEAITIGICKINIATDLQVAFISRVRKILENDSKIYDPRKILGPAEEDMKSVVKNKMELFMSAGKV